MEPSGEQRGSGGRRFGGSRLRRRTPVAPAVTEEQVRAEPLQGELLESEPADPFSDPYSGGSLPSGRFRVVGCSPGCLMLSIAASIVLTILLNLLLHIR